MAQESIRGGPKLVVGSARVYGAGEREAGVERNMGGGSGEGKLVEQEKETKRERESLREGEEESSLWKGSRVDGVQGGEWRGRTGGQRRIFSYSRLPA